MVAGGPISQPAVYLYFGFSLCCFLTHLSMKLHICAFGNIVHVYIGCVDIDPDCLHFAAQLQ